MRIALLSFEYPPETGFGGIGTYAYYQARALARLGHDVHVFAGSQKDGRFHSEHEGVKVTRVKHGGWLNRWLQVARQKRAWWFHNRVETGFAAYKALRHELERSTFDFVEAPECGGDAIVSTTLLSIPTAVRFHSPARLIMGVYDTPKMDRELCAFVEQLAINQAQVLTSCSRFLADEVALKMNVRTPIHVIPNGIDLELFDRDEGIDAHGRFGIPAGKEHVTVFFANRMEERKGIHIVKDMVFHCLKQYPHVTFVFAGRDLFGYMEKRILPWVKDNQLQARFRYLGQLDLASVRAVLKRTDIFLIPSLWENCPYSCLEAMAAGVGIVSSDCGGMPELLEHERTGLLARNGDPQSFVAALSRMIEDPGLRARCGSAARKEVELRLTDVAIASRTVEVYQRHLDHNPVPAETTADRRRRVDEETARRAAAGAAATAPAEVADLRARLSRLQGTVDDAARTQEQALREIRAAREWRLGSWLLNDLGLATASRRAKKWLRKARNLKTRAGLRVAGGTAPRVVLAATWDFPSPTHTFVYQEMQSLIGAGFDARVFFWNTAPEAVLAGRFAEVLRRRVRLEPVYEIQDQDLRHLERTRPGRLNAFLERVATASGCRLDDLRRQPLVAQGCTFARMAELFGARYLHSYFFYEQSFMAMLASEVLGIPRGISAYADHMLADWPFKLVPLQLQTAQLVVATSRRVKDELVRIGGAAVADRILVKPDGVDGESLRAVPQSAAAAGADVPVTERAFHERVRALVGASGK
jgi:glycogen(starch) synthase